MSKPVIKAENLTKEYRIYRKNSQRMKAVFFGTKGGIVKTAAQNISYEIQKGEKVCILGRLGAGRSTMLKMISGITFPNSGSIEVNGKVNAIFDLKVGFDAELTGRDNLYIKGSILGWSRKEIKEHEQEIIDFSEIGEYIDLPIKTYTPGMSARLGFALHTTFKPEIFVMDENFAVGDKVFRAKCVAKIIEIINDPEVTFVMTTRNMAFARQLCDRGLVMDKGELVFDGPILEAIQFLRENCKPEGKKTLEEEMEDRAVQMQFEEDDEDEDYGI